MAVLDNAAAEVAAIIGTDPSEVRRVAGLLLTAIRDLPDAAKAVDEVHWGYSCHVCGGARDHWRGLIDALRRGDL